MNGTVGICRGMGVIRGAMRKSAGMGDYVDVAGVMDSLRRISEPVASGLTAVGREHPVSSAAVLAGIPSLAYAAYRATKGYWKPDKPRKAKGGAGDSAEEEKSETSSKSAAAAAAPAAGHGRFGK